MAIDIKNILEIVQRKVANVDASTSTADLQKLLNLAKRVDGSLMRTYDSDGSLPDAGSTTERMAYITSTGVVKFNNGRWDNLTGTALSAGGGGASGPFVWQGSTSGYMMGGFSPYSNVIQSYSFTADGNASDVGDLLTTPYGGIGSSDGTNAYNGGGQTPSYTAQVNKFPFAAGGNATDAGDLSSVRSAGGTSHTQQAGYMLSGRDPSGNITTIEKLTHSSGTGAEVTATVTNGRNRPWGSGSSSTHAYIIGGYTNTVSTDIDKMPFASEDATSDVGDISNNRYNNQGGVSSEDACYAQGGWPSAVNFRHKVSFASDGNSVSTGAISYGRYGTGATSSTTHGYAHGGVAPSFPGSYANIIDKFPYASDTETSTDVGDATQSPGIAYAQGVQI